MLHRQFGLLTGMDEIDKLAVSYGWEARMKASIKKKTYNLDEEMIDKVRRLFSVKTDTEAIQRALRKTLEDQEVQESLDRLLREGRFRTIYR
jgi:Arc/MetJ family transcription regulator